MPSDSQSDLKTDPQQMPLVLAGPMLRKCTTTQIVLWLALRVVVNIRIEVSVSGSAPIIDILEPRDTRCTWISAGKHLHYVLIQFTCDSALPNDTCIGYTLGFQLLNEKHSEWIDQSECIDNLCYPEHETPMFMLPSIVRSMLQGSCRKPHQSSPDGLREADRFLEQLLSRDGESLDSQPHGEESVAWPSFLMLTGDQVYVDDVAGPMLHAIHQVIDKLGLPDELFDCGALSPIENACQLYRHPFSFYQREKLLPRHKGHFDLIEVLFGGVEKPIFTTDSAHNHLITLGEMLAMYLLCWSPAAWQMIDWTVPDGLSEANRSLYIREQTALKQFVQDLPSVRRLFAHLPTAMIFDDHDITDDWNLSREWEEVAYGHPFSRRVIGNALVAYQIHQGWGNDPEAFSPCLIQNIQATLLTPGLQAHDETLNTLFQFRRWNFIWQTNPPLVVIDTRTHRWRSETAARKPSGLMDWESLTNLQQQLKGLPAVLLVSPTPIFGVKLIEVIQRIFSWLGKPLMVDAENWMAHPGSGHAILNIFQHPQTPRHFVVLSGDVHYSFVYDVEIRGQEKGPDIWQICSSGLRNQFPAKLLDWLDLANRWLYSPRSPLNWFTRRRRMRIIPRKPEGTAHGRRLLNGSGVGLVELTNDGVPWRISCLLACGRKIKFVRREEESRWE